MFAAIKFCIFLGENILLPFNFTLLHSLEFERIFKNSCSFQNFEKGKRYLTKAKVRTYFKRILPGNSVLIMQNIIFFFVSIDFKKYFEMY